ncbi:MAG: hypothetical protein EKK53_24260 [Burkholderiales bacterium]|nr:MAG: hypothetical protein EKK53_24260 [Burkholderiales bacterium]
MKMPTPRHEGLYDAQDLLGAFHAQFPDANDQEIAALLAAFLEDVSPVTTTDDGLEVEQTDADELAAVRAWISELKAFAGDAYPPHRDRPS